MTPEETKQAASVMVASETKNIQQRYRHGKSDDGWVDVPDPEWDWDTFDYRIGPEPLEVEVWWNPDTQNMMRFGSVIASDAERNGYTLRRATIHPKEVKS